MSKCENCIHNAVCLFIKDKPCMHYKDKSLFVELPCKVGETVYRITKLYNGSAIIVEGVCFEFTITHEGAENDKYRFYFWAKPDDTFTTRMYSLWCEFADFGKTVFLDREEAEGKKLKEMG